MKLQLSFFATLMILLAGRGTLTAQVPDGGIMLNATSGTTFQQIGQCTATAVTVDGQAFTDGIRIEVGSGFSNTYSAQVKFPSVDGIADGDVLLVAFYARTIYSEEETGEGNVNVIIENNSTYAKQIQQNIKIGSEWKEYYASAVSGTTLGASQVSYLFHCGFPNQVIEIAEVRYLNYEQTRTLDEMPVTEITYAGQDPAADWRAPAAERINQYRKGLVEFTVYDEQGQLLQDADLSVEMVQHDFGFGTAIGASTFNNNETYRTRTLEDFNEVVFENDLKWPQFNANNTAHIEKAMDTLDAHNIPVRGHNVIWPSYRFMPDFVEQISDDPVALENAIDNRIDDVTQFTSGRLNDWDVINEAYTEHDLMDIMGDQVMAEWFKKVRRNDRDVKLYLNDYAILSGGGKNVAKQDFYYNLVEYIDGLGGGVQGIGLQGHFSSELTSINKVYSILERYAALEKEIKITEFDIDITQREVQADYLRDFMTITFSHPSVKSVLMWGFWENKHWKPDCAIYNADWTLRPHGEMWLDLIYNQWWTKDTTMVTDASGNGTMTGFLGTYRYTVTDGNIVRTGTFTIDRPVAGGLTNEVVLSLDQAVPETVSVSSSIPGYICEGETAVLSVPEGDGLLYTWYLDGEPLDQSAASISVSEPGSYSVDVAKSGITISSEPYLLEVRSTPVAQITPSGEVGGCLGKEITLETTAVEGVEYAWHKNGTQFLADVASVEITNSGSYTLQASSEFCTAKSEAAVVLLDRNPDTGIEASGDLSACIGDGLFLTAANDASVDYTWFKDDEETGSGQFYLEISETGDYHFSATVGSCTAYSDTLPVKFNEYPEASITVNGETMFCEGTELVLEGNPGTDLVYTWMKGSLVLEDADQTIAVGESGTYTLMTTLGNCATTSDPVVLTLLPATDPACANSVTETELANIVYPNPFRGSFTFDPGNLTGKTRLELFNATGQLLMVKSLDTLTGPIKIESPEKGLLLLKITNGNAVSIHRVTSV